MEVTNVNLPSKFSRQSISYFLSQIVDSNKKPISNRICFNFNTLNFIRPAGVAVLSNILQWLEERHNVIVSFAMPEHLNTYITQSHPIKFLDDCGFFRQHTLKQLFPYSQIRSTTIPLSLVKYHDSYQWLESTFLPWLSRNTGQENLIGFATIKICMMEIINNIKDHSQEEIGCFFGQFFPREDRIIISVSDFGIGIPNRMRTIFPDLTDTRALKKATEEGITTQTSQRNRGAGLDILISNVVNNWGGEIFIHTNHAKMICFKDQTGKSAYNLSYSKDYYPGTYIEIIIGTDCIYVEPDDEDFQW